jgi:hypothetical protein
LRSLATLAQITDIRPSPTLPAEFERAVWADDHGLLESLAACLTDKPAPIDADDPSVSCESIVKDAALCLRNLGRWSGG